jgi:hypothetical protein
MRAASYQSVESPRQMAARALAREQAKPLAVLAGMGAAPAVVAGGSMAVRELGAGVVHLVHAESGEVLGVFASAALAAGTRDFLQR